MQAYEFLAKPQNGIITIPDELKHIITSSVKVIILQISQNKEDITVPFVQESLTSAQLDIAKNVLSGVMKITENGLSAETLEAFESLENGDFKPSFEERLP
jgi:hypothetical protein